MKITITFDAKYTMSTETTDKEMLDYFTNTPMETLIETTRKVIMAESEEIEDVEISNYKVDFENI